MWQHLNEGRSIDDKRRLEVQLPVGRYKFAFRTHTVNCVVGDRRACGRWPLDLPDLHVQTLAWVEMLGKPPAEIEAFDLEGKPVKLADYRGKVIVLAFWSSKNESELPFIPHLIAIQKRFHDQPLAILALHDASLTSLTKYREHLEPLRTNSPVRSRSDSFLTDLPAVTQAAPRSARTVGMTADAYETSAIVATFVIDKRRQAGFRDHGGMGCTTTFAVGENGKLVREFAKPTFGRGLVEREFAIGSLEAVLEDQFGLPKSHSAKPTPGERQPRSEPNGPLVVKGKVVDLNGKPIAGASLLESATLADPQGAKEELADWQLSSTPRQSGPSGEFSFTFDEGGQFLGLAVEGLGLATKVFRFGFRAKGDLPVDRLGSPSSSRQATFQPSEDGSGAAITGRVVRHGIPVGGVIIGLKYDDDLQYDPYEELETKTDEQGAFRFPHVLPQTNYWAYASWGA